MLSPTLLNNLFYLRDFAGMLSLSSYRCITRYSLQMLSYFLFDDVKLQIIVCAHNYFNSFLSYKAVSLISVKESESFMTYLYISYRRL